MLKNLSLFIYLLQSSRNFVESCPVIPSLFDNLVGDQLVSLRRDDWRIVEYNHLRNRGLCSLELSESILLLGLAIEV